MGKFDFAPVDPDDLPMLNEPKVGGGMVSYVSFVADKHLCIFLGTLKNPAKSLYNLNPSWKKQTDQSAPKVLLTGAEMDDLAIRKQNGQDIGGQNLTHDLALYISKEQEAQYAEYFEEVGYVIGKHLNAKKAFGDVLPDDVLRTMLKRMFHSPIATDSKTGMPILRINVEHDTHIAKPHVKIVVGKDEDGQFRYDDFSVKDLRSEKNGGLSKLQNADVVVYAQDNGIWFRKDSYGLKLRAMQILVQPNAGGGGGSAAASRAEARSMDVWKMLDPNGIRLANDGAEPYEDYNNN